MGLFKRKPPIDHQAPRCPACNERVPEGATACAMCGRDLHDFAARAERRFAAVRAQDGAA
jgi:hypothetical protein